MRDNRTGLTLLEGQTDIDATAGGIDIEGGNVIEFSTGGVTATITNKDASTITYTPILNGARVFVNPLTVSTIQYAGTISWS